LGSCVALLALALQLVLSFGHIHSKDLLGHSAPTPIADALIGAALSDDDATTSSDRAGHHEDEYCAIYAIAALIGSAQQAEPPTLPLPLVLASAPPPVAVESLSLEQRHRLSQARAPPLA